MYRISVYSLRSSDRHGGAHHEADVASVLGHLQMLRWVMAGETIHLFNFYRADVADGERAAAMLWRWRHASESGVFKIGTGTGRSLRGLMLALGDHVPFIPIEEAVRDYVSHHLSQPDPYLEAA